MANSSVNSQSEPSPLTGPSSFGSAIDSQGLSTVHEIPHQRARCNDTASMDHRLLSSRFPFDEQRSASLDSSLEQSFNEKQLESSTQQTRYTTQTTAARKAWKQSEAPPVPMSNGYPRNNRAECDSKSTSSKKEKKGRFRNTIRRMFGRRSPKDRISMPAPTVYAQHVRWLAVRWLYAQKMLISAQDPDEFITSANDVKPKQRSASVPVHTLTRTSGLSSHPPFQAIPGPASVIEPPAPPQPEQRPPERPARPRRASVPSITFNKEETRAVEGGMTGLGIQNTQDLDVDARNIGFAVTNGSNPKRRSRSVGPYLDTDHRMSPIQWRRWRGRSDEIRHWRESTDLIGSPEMPARTAKGDDNDTIDDGKSDLGEHNGDFNFGLPGDAMQNPERIDYEERIVTLEIKLMDLELAISKLQTGSTSPIRHRSHFAAPERHESVGSYFSSDPPKASELAQGSRATISPNFSSEPGQVDPRERPTSVATTLKPGPSAQYVSPRKGSPDHSTRSSFTGFTIEQYTTLITLIRREQSARMLLEQQVTTLQKQLERISPPHAAHTQNSSNPQPVSQSLRSIPHSHHSHKYSQSSQQRRQGIVGHYPRPRPRSSSYSTNETDTDDDAFHETFVTPDITPVERGEYERGTFEGVSDREEGVAF